MIRNEWRGAVDKNEWRGAVDKERVKHEEKLVIRHEWREACDKSFNALNCIGYRTRLKLGFIIGSTIK